jgi:Transposase DDE domain
VTDDPELSAVGLIPTYEKRWAVELFFKDSKQLLGLGHYQNRSCGAAVTHLHLVCFAYALLTHLRVTRDGAQGERVRKKAADWSVAAAQDNLRGLIWDDLVAYLEEKHHAESVLKELERLRLAS